MNFERPPKSDFSRLVRQATYVDLAQAGDGRKCLAGRMLRGRPDLLGRT